MLFTPPIRRLQLFHYYAIFCRFSLLRHFDAAISSDYAAMMRMPCHAAARRRLLLLTLFAAFAIRLDAAFAYAATPPAA